MRHPLGGFYMRIFGEGEPVSVLEAVDREINAIRLDWIGRLASHIFKVNPRDTTAEDIALAYICKQRVPEKNIQSLFRRPQIAMWAIFYPPNTEPEFNSYSMLHLRATLNLKAFIDSVRSPLEI